MPSPFISPVFYNSKTERFTLTETDITNGYVELEVSSIVEYSLNAWVDRSAIFEGFDFNIQLVSGTIRLVFAGSLLPAGAEALAAGDVLTINYWTTE
jgi:hypothetical protein